MQLLYARTHSTSLVSSQARCATSLSATWTHPSAHIVSRIKKQTTILSDKLHSATQTPSYYRFSPYHVACTMISCEDGSRVRTRRYRGQQATLHKGHVGQRVRKKNRGTGKGKKNRRSVCKRKMNFKKHILHRLYFRLSCREKKITGAVTTKTCTGGRRGRGGVSHVLWRC